jgi:DedD protein
MDDVVKRRAAGALVLIGLAFIAVSLLPGVGETPGEDGVKVVVIDLNEDGEAQPVPDAIAMETPPTGVAAAAPGAPEADDAQGTDSLPDPGAETLADRPIEADETTAAAAAPRPALKLAEAIVAAPERAEPAEPAPKPAPAAPAVKPVKPAVAPAPAPVDRPELAAAKPAPAPAGAWYVQVGGFADINNARQVQDRVKAQGQASIIAPMDSAKGTLYRVRAGPYASREAAAAAQQKLAAGGFTGSALIGP